MKPNNMAQLWQRLKPFAVRDLGVSQDSASNTSSGLVSHSLSGPYHSGQLAESQATWAVTDSEFVAHTSNPNVHHFRSHSILSTVDHTYSGGEALDIFGLSAPSTLTRLTPSAAPGAATAILKSDDGGQLTLPLFTATTKVTTPLIDSTGDLTLSPDGFDVILDASVNLVSSNYVSETAGFRLPSSGAADILSVTTNEMTSRQSIYGAGTAFRVLHHTHDYDHAHVVVNPGGSWNLDEQFGVDIDDNLLVRGYIVGKHAIQLPGAMMICHYDGAEPYESNFTGNPMGHMGQVGTENGAVIYRAGKFGKAVQLAEATSNLIINPSFENGQNGWPNSFTGTGDGTREISAEQSRSGLYSMKMAQTAGAAGNEFGIVTNVNMINGATYTASAWIYVPELTQGTVGVYVADNSAAFAYEVLSAATTGWVRVQATMTSTISAAGSVYILFFGGRGTVYVDDVQLEQKTYATPYCDGSLGNGHAWTGAAHASTSTRSAALLSYSAESVLSPTAMTVGFWVRRSGASNGYIVAHPGMSIEFI